MPPSPSCFTPDAPASSRGAHGTLASGVHFRLLNHTHKRSGGLRGVLMSWGRGFLAIGTVAKKEPDLRDPYAYIASTCDDDDLEPALHDAPSPNFDGLVIEEVTPEELEALNV